VINAEESDEAEKKRYLIVMHDIILVLIEGEGCSEESLLVVRREGS